MKPENQNLQIQFKNISLSFWITFKNIFSVNGLKIDNLFLFVFWVYCHKTFAIGFSVNFDFSLRIYFNILMAKNLEILYEKLFLTIFHIKFHVCCNIVWVEDWINFFISKKLWILKLVFSFSILKTKINWKEKKDFLLFKWKFIKTICSVFICIS